LFSRHGYEAVTLRQLGRAAGIEAGSLYYYIKSKQDLLFRILKETLDEDFAELENRLSAVQSPMSRLATFIEWFVRGIIAKKQTCFLWTSEIRSLKPANYRVISKKSRLFVDRLEDIVRQGTAAGLYREPDIEGTVFAIWGLLSSPLMWLYPAQRTDVDGTIALLTRISFRCLAVEPATATVSTPEQDCISRPPAKDRVESDF